MTYKGANGGGASAKALDTSAPITIMFFSAAVAQKILDAVWSKEAAYVSPSVTVPLILGFRYRHIGLS